MEEFDEIINDETLEPTPTAPMVQPVSSGSNLPSWVLRMRESIEASRVAHLDAEARIQNLHSEVARLGDKLDEMLPHRKQSMIVPEATAEKETIPDKNFDGRVVMSRPFKSNLKLVDLPSDMIYLICSHLQFGEVFRLRRVSTQWNEVISTNVFWVIAGKKRLRFLLKKHPTFLITPVAAMVRIAHYTRQLNQSLRFLQLMKDQRSIPKHRQVAPHRYSRSERNISHPLPLFDSSINNTTSSTANGSSSAQDPQRIMSHAETLSSDFRSLAHAALEDMVQLSGCLYRPVAEAFVTNGVVTVMASLLANEEASIQNYACCVLANLLGWEARAARKRRQLVLKRVSRVRSSRQVEVDIGSDNDDDDAGNDNSVSGRYPPSSSFLSSVSPSLQDQILACNALRQLASLLTSPSAAVNLVRSSFASIATGSSSRSTGVGYSGTGMQSGSSSATVGVNSSSSAATASTSSSSSRIQGVCNRQASRALVTLLLPDFPVHVTTYTAASSRDNATTSSIAPFSQGTKQIATPLNQSTPSGFSLSDPHSSDPLHASSPATSTSCSYSHRLMYEERDVIRAWQFTYFYKSGALKDMCTTYLRFCHDVNASAGVDEVGRSGQHRLVSRGKVLVFGGGIDHIGSFMLSGEAQADIVAGPHGTFFWQKTYLQHVSFDVHDRRFFHKDLQPLLLSPSAADHSHRYTGSNVDDDNNEQIQQLLLQGGSQNASASGGGGGGGGAHVLHVAYWSEGTAASSTSTFPSNSSSNLPAQSITDKKPLILASLSTDAQPEAQLEAVSEARMDRIAVDPIAADLIAAGEQASKGERGILNARHELWYDKLFASLRLSGIRLISSAHTQCMPCVRKC